MTADRAGHLQDPRLAEQDKYIAAALGFSGSLHPTIISALKASDEGIRLVEVIPSLLPSQRDFVSVHPERLSIKDITSPAGVPSQHLQAYHVVYVKLIQSSIAGEEWSVAMRNLVSLLRPGGFIQWVDWDPLTVRVAGAKPGTSDQALRQLLLRYTDALKANGVGTTYKISNGLRAAGLENDDSDIYQLTPDATFTSNIVKGAVNLLRGRVDTDWKQVEELWDQVQEEIRTGGPLLWYDLWCHIARKPPS